MHFCKFCLCIGLLCLAVGPLAEAWVARANYHNDAHPGKCTNRELTKNLHILVNCGAVGTPEGCKWGDYVNKDAPFQECCARHLVCEGGLTAETRHYEKHYWDMFSRNSKNTANE